LQALSEHFFENYFFWRIIGERLQTPAFFGIIEKNYVEVYAHGNG